MILAPRTVTEPRALRKKFVVDCSPSKTSTLKINRLISELMESGLDIRIGSVIREKNSTAVLLVTGYVYDENRRAYFIKVRDFVSRSESTCYMVNQLTLDKRLIHHRTKEAKEKISSAAKYMIERYESDF